MMVSGSIKPVPSEGSFKSWCDDIPCHVFYEWDPAYRDWDVIAVAYCEHDGSPSRAEIPLSTISHVQFSLWQQEINENRYNNQ